jgi:hypothetical protein
MTRLQVIDVEAVELLIVVSLVGCGERGDGSGVGGCGLGRRYLFTSFLEEGVVI